MRRIYWVQGLVVLGLLLGGWPGARAQGVEGALPFYPRPLVNFGRTSSDADPQIGWLQAAGEWVAYGVPTTYCPTCGSYLRLLGLRNVLDGRSIAVQTATVDSA